MTHLGPFMSPQQYMSNLLLRGYTNWGSVNDWNESAKLAWEEETKSSSIKPETLEWDDKEVIVYHDIKVFTSVSLALSEAEKEDAFDGH